MNFCMTKLYINLMEKASIMFLILFCKRSRAILSKNIANSFYDKIFWQFEGQKGNFSYYLIKLLHLLYKICII
jgi:hypothetical protein